MPIVDESSIQDIMMLYKSNALTNEQKNRTFTRSCKLGLFEFAKWIYDFMGKPKELLLIGDAAGFRWACESGKENIAKWIFNESVLQNCTIDIRCRDDYAIRNSAKNGYTNIFLWLFDLMNELYNCSYNIANLEYQVYRWACEYGHLDMVKLLLELDPKIKNNIIFEYPFRRACANGHLHVVKFLLTNFDVNISELNDYAFYNAFKNGHKNITKFLLELDANIFNYINVSKLVRDTCSNNNLKIILWLYQKFPSIQIDYDTILRKVCKLNHHKMFKWILETQKDIDVHQHNDFLLKHAKINNNIIMLELLNKYK